MGVVDCESLPLEQAHFVEQVRQSVEPYHLLYVLFLAKPLQCELELAILFNPSTQTALEAAAKIAYERNEVIVEDVEAEFSMAFHVLLEGLLGLLNAARL